MGVYSKNCISDEIDDHEATDSNTVFGVLLPVEVETFTSIEVIGLFSLFAPLQQKSNLGSAFFTSAIIPRNIAPIGSQRKTATWLILLNVFWAEVIP